MRRLRSFLRRFGSDRKAATALEFAIVVTPFIVMIFAVFEYMLVYLVTVTLDTATNTVARQIRTGEAQKANMTAADFKAAVCDNMGWLQSECSTQLYVDARVFAVWTGQTAPDPVAGGNFNAAALTFNMGGPGTIVLVRTFYQWRLLTPALTAGLSSLTGGIDVITSQAVFQNEPYGSGP